jgi:hypothetical protein
VHFTYDVCLSFAGEDRGIARELAAALKDAGLSVFYDEYEQTKLWGKDLFTHLHAIYSEQSRFCILLFSKAYLQKVWTNHELKAAQRRTLHERSGYVLPIRIDETALPPELETTAYLTLTATDYESIIQTLMERISADLRAEGWLNVDEVAEKLTMMAINTALVNEFMTTVQTQRDDVEALRVALLSLIYLTQDHEDERIRSYISFLLSGFHPLASTFNSDNTHELVPPDGQVLRWLNEDGRFELRMQLQFVEPRVRSIKERWGLTDKDIEE